MKVLRAVYNRAVDNGYALYIPRLFRHVHTSVCADQRRSLDASDIGNLLYETEKVPINGTLPLNVQKTKILFAAYVFAAGNPIC